MSFFLWVLQTLLALHTAIGAGWKLFNSEQAVPTLAALPHWVWTVLIPLELICAAGLVIPALAPSLGWLVPVAAIGIAIEMLVFSGVHLRAGTEDSGPMFYWLGVAAVCVVIALGRLFIVPL
ncbi:MAG: DoxX family protein [Limimaricola soesokkakensis]|uniref:DoxX family protein n=1 Tax=Limimaricola soesokkakensis TaxID=1343159 RepID=UPI0040592DDD